MKLVAEVSLIQKKNLTSRLHTLHNSRSLGSTSAGIRGGEAVGVFFIWKIIDEKRDIDFPDQPSVLGAEFHSSRIGDHIFAAVPGDMVINTALQR